MKELTVVAMELLNTLIKAGMPYDKAIDLVCGKTTTADNKSAYQHQEAQPKVENKISKPAKAESKKSTTAKADKKPSTTKGSVKKNDLFKVVNLNTNTVVAVGKAKEVNKKESAVVSTSGKKYALENCEAISKATYNKLKKSLAVSKAKAEKKSTSKRLAPVDYKLVYAINLKKIGKINEVELQKAKDDQDFATELYKKFSAEVKLDNAEALKIFAENTAKGSTKVETANA